MEQFRHVIFVIIALVFAITMFEIKLMPTIPPISEKLRSYFELFYFLGGIALGIVGIIGLRQISLIKFDITTRCKREAMECSIRFVDRYLDKCVPLLDNMNQIVKEKDLPRYPGTIENLPPLNKEILEKLKIRHEILKLHKLGNEFEIISSGIMSGLCDEQFVFESIGRSYCDSLASYYDFILMTEENGYFPNTRKLFLIWTTKLLKQKVENEKKRCDELLSSIPDKQVKTIGS